MLALLGFTPDGWTSLIQGLARSTQPTAPEISAALLDAMSPFDADAGGLRVRARLAVPSATEASFWHRQLLPNGSARLIFCRLINGPSNGDLLVARSLACYRAMTLLADTGAHEQLSGLPLEIERLSSEPYQLHAVTADCAPDGSCTVWNAGSAQVVRIDEEGTLIPLVTATQPFSRGVRETSHADTSLCGRTQLLCAHGADDQGPNRLLEIAQSELAPEAGGPALSVWTISENA
jgi:hypothetical protein